MEITDAASKRKSGSEPFHDGGHPVGGTLLEFWQWSASDLVSNATRGVLAEYIVALALGGAWEPMRREWDAYDLKLANGTKIEVKSAAYVQAWKQARPSTIIFQVGKRRWWDAETGMSSDEPARHADIYVFALLRHEDRDTLDPLNVAQWEFYVLPTRVLNERTRSQHSITLPSLRELSGGPRTFQQLRNAVDLAATG
ncbi:MAG: hypothetical protein NW216_07200 [Hyphomicrobium sp.]|nr:hypothetical protein [Hyphomicrobium sp.]